MWLYILGVLPFGYRCQYFYIQQFPLSHFSRFFLFLFFLLALSHCFQKSIWRENSSDTLYIQCFHLTDGLHQGIFSITVTYFDSLFSNIRDRALPFRLMLQSNVSVQTSRKPLFLTFDLSISILVFCAFRCLLQ